MLYSLTPKDLTVGQDVIVVDNSRRERREKPGTVTKIGRLLVTIEYGENARFRYTDQFRLDGQYLSGDFVLSSYFRTLDQAADENRREEALRELREQLGHVPLVNSDKIPTGRLLRAAAILSGKDDPIIGQIVERGVDFDRLSIAMRAGDNWGQMIYSFEYLTVIQAVLDHWKDPSASG